MYALFQSQQKGVLDQMDNPVVVLDFENIRKFNISDQISTVVISIPTAPRTAGRRGGGTAAAAAGSA